MVLETELEAWEGERVAVLEAIAAKLQIDASTLGSLVTRSIITINGRHRPVDAR